MYALKKLKKNNSSKIWMMPINNIDAYDANS